MTATRPATLRIGTRPSALAVAQSGAVAERLRAAGHAGRAGRDAHRRATGRRAPVAELGVGVFVSALREALVRGEVDVAVHSYKDLPTAPDPRLALAAVPAREDPRDALVARDGKVLGELPVGLPVGTGSPAARAQLDALGPRAARSCRSAATSTPGSARSRSGELDAVVVAAAGLRRLGRVDEATELLDPLQMLPAPAQGALAVECRASPGGPDRELAAALAPCSTTRSPGPRSPPSARCSPPWRPAAAPRSGRSPTWCRDLDDDGHAVDRISLRAVIGTADGALLRASATGDLDDAEKLGAALAAELLDMGGRRHPREPPGETLDREFRDEPSTFHPRAGSRSWAVAPATPAC